VGVPAHRGADAARPVPRLHGGPAHPDGAAQRAALLHPEHAHEYPFCSQLAAGWDKPWLLYVAALFHDIAKGRGGDHSELGATEVRASAATMASDGDDAR
jgi:UTP:GlnB (protein PII) uridylyltransferase